MKKLSLKASIFNKGEVLTRAQLKKVMGGDGSESGGDQCIIEMLVNGNWTNAGIFNATNSNGSSEAETYCIQQRELTGYRCKYDCGHDGWGQ